mgnify:FL=1
MNVILIVGVVACVINVILTLVGVPIFPMPHIGF